MVWDLLNWQTLVIALIIGTGLAIFLFWRQHNLQKAQNKILQRLDTIISREDTRQIRRKGFYIVRIIESLSAIEGHHIQLKGLILDFIKDGSDTNKERIVNLSKTASEVIEHYHVPSIKRYMEELTELLGDPKLAFAIPQLCETFATMFKDMLEDYVWKEDYNLANKVEVIDTMIATIDNLRTRLTNDISQ